MPAHAHTPPTVIRFIAPPDDRVNAPRAGYVVGLLDVAGYAVRGVMPDDAFQFRRAVRILRITQRGGLIVRERDGLPTGANEVFVRVGSRNERPAQSTFCAPGAGTPDDPIRDDGDPIATGRAILRAVRVPDEVPRS